jgi:hypothetical protein
MHADSSAKRRISIPHVVDGVKGREAACLAAACLAAACQGAPAAQGGREQQQGVSHM